MMSSAERRIIGVIGLMRGIIASFLRRFICTLLSMVSLLFPMLYGLRGCLHFL
jgi:hypothetical protein